ncbi:MAG: sporulation protein YunB [Ruminococcaceae bacterium]|nr:sporulation protein YunB [Oscillospiraceae bacterium]
MLSDKTRRILRSLGFKLISVALIFMGLAVMIDLSIRPIVETVNAYECHLAVSEIITTAVEEELQREDISYSKLVDITTNSDGEVISVESNVVNINLMKSGITKRLERELHQIREINIDIPIGTLSGIQLLHGKGFDIGMTVEPMGYPQTKIISEFTEAGINQTRHRIIIDITVVADAIIPGYSTNVEVKTSLIAAETIIVGRVPDAYTHVVSSDGDLVGTLEDYEADTFS